MQIVLLACLAAALVIVPAVNAQDEAPVDKGINEGERNSKKDTERENAVKKIFEESETPGMISMHTGVCRDANCKSCPERDDICEECIVMFMPIRASDINGCPEFCTDCEASHDRSRKVCTACVDLYEIKGESCKPQCLVANCTSCNINDGNVCIDCDPDYTLTADAKCDADCLVEHCKECQDGEHQVCVECNEHFEVDPNDASVCNSMCYVDYCLTCPFGISDKCSECEYPYHLDEEGQCVNTCKVPNCQSCLHGRPTHCQVCEEGYGRDNEGWCKEMDEDCNDPNCIQCKSATSTCNEEEGSNQYCATCLVGWTLIDCECVDKESECGSGCLDCQAGECYECHEGFEMADDGQCYGPSK